MAKKPRPPAPVVQSEIWIEDFTFNEADGTGTFNVYLWPLNQQTVSIDWATIDGTALAGQDYTASSGTLTFPPGSGTQTITIALNNDTFVESNETFNVRFSNITGPARLGTGDDGNGIVTLVSDDVEAPPPPPPPPPSDGLVEYYGVKISGGEFGMPGGQLWQDYIYPEAYQLDYWASKGVNTIQLPFYANHLMQGGLNDNPQEDIAIIEGIIDHAQTLGMNVMISPSHSARMVDGGTSGGASWSGKLLGTPEGNQEFYDQWYSFASWLKDEPNVIYVLESEPRLQNATELLPALNMGIDAIRDAGGEQLILVPGAYYTGAWSWTTSDNAAVIGEGIVDPLDNYAFVVNQYLDANHSGQGYAVEGAHHRVEAVTEWARAEGEQLFLGEYGWFFNDELGAQENKLMLDYINENSDVWIGTSAFAAGAWWGDHWLSLEPSSYGGQDAPQVAVMDDYWKSDTIL